MDPKVDIEDADLLGFRWCNNGNGYARRRNPLWGYENHPYNLYLHRVVAERTLGRALQRGEQVDHINGDRSDNRRSNLRVVNNAQNQHNSGIGKNNRSGFKGVFWDRHAGKWRATIWHQRRRIYVGVFETAEEGALAYDRIARQIFGVYARPNFPELADATGSQCDSRH